MLITLLTTLFALAVLVTVHEAGHYIVARWCGVKVMRFSVGFGRPVFRHLGNNGTEYVFAWIPLGGYVKMLDSRNDEISSVDLCCAFDHKSPWQRIAIVAAGPLVNLLFAGLLYGIVYLSGTPQLIPVAVAANNSVSGFETPQQIVAVDGNMTPTWEAVNIALTKRMGETSSIAITTHPLDQSLLQAQAMTPNPLDALPLVGGEEQHDFPVHQWMSDAVEFSPLSQLGLKPWRPNVPITLDYVTPQGAAELAGLTVGDTIVAVDQLPMLGYNEFVGYIQTHPNAAIKVTLERGSRVLDIPVQLGSYTNEKGAPTGLIGVGVAAISWPYSMQFMQQLGFLDSFLAGGAKAIEMARLTLSFLGQMVQGLVSVEHLSGPISIAKIAGASAESGLITYISFMAYLSVSLGVLNLLPVPMLDGGHLLYYLIEVVTGRKVPDRIQAIGLRIGMALVFSIMIIAVANDLMRL
ncbi:MAG: RIP metalloprotease RseP [Gammaproteobacteria bacterium]|nr:RIP metalloprotease RseP [Gammaproteobacteria bacterium]